jgi:hypothetical protein
MAGCRESRRTGILQAYSDERRRDIEEGAQEDEEIPDCLRSAEWVLPLAGIGGGAQRRQEIMLVKRAAGGLKEGNETCVLYSTTRHHQGNLFPLPKRVSFLKETIRNSSMDPRLGCFSRVRVGLCIQNDHRTASIGLRSWEMAES